MPFWCFRKALGVVRFASRRLARLGADSFVQWRIEASKKPGLHCSCRSSGHDRTIQSILRKARRTFERGARPLGREVGPSRETKRRPSHRPYRRDVEAKGGARARIQEHVRVRRKAFEPERGLGRAPITGGERVETLPSDPCGSRRKPNQPHRRRVARCTSRRGQRRTTSFRLCGDDQAGCRRVPRPATAEARLHAVDSEAICPRSEGWELAPSGANQHFTIGGAVSPRLRGATAATATEHPTPAHSGNTRAIQLPLRRGPAVQGETRKARGSARRGESPEADGGASGTSRGLSARPEGPEEETRAPGGQGTQAQFRRGKISSGRDFERGAPGVPVRLVSGSRARARASRVPVRVQES